MRGKEENDTFVGDGGMEWRRLRRPARERDVELALWTTGTLYFLFMV